MSNWNAAGRRGNLKTLLEIRFADRAGVDLPLEEIQNVDTYFFHYNIICTREDGSGAIS